MNDKIRLSLLLILGIALGIAGTMGYQSYYYTRTYDGLFSQNNNSQPQAIENAKQFDSNGNWVCVNVRGMKYQDAITTCNHEVGHEIFAVYCQDHIQQCINLTNGSSS